MTGFEAWLLAYLFNSAWQVPLLLAAAWLSARAQRPAGAAAEHRVWVVALVMQSLLPALCAMPWAWLRILAIFGNQNDGVDGAHVAIVAGAGSAISGTGWSSAMLAASALAYCLATLYFAAQFLWRIAALSRLVRGTVPVVLTGELADIWQHYSKRFGVPDVAMATSPDIRGPMTMGYFRKTVLLPANVLTDISMADFQTVVAHEFAHVNRNDFAKNLFYEWLAISVSYHPLSWLTRTRLAESREMVCDQAAAEVAGRKEYTQSLLRLAAVLIQGPPVDRSHAIGIFDAHMLERRMMKLTERQQNIGRTRRAAMVAACIALGIGTCVSALALRVGVQAPVTAAASDAAPPKRVTIASSVMAGNKLTGPSPEYPAAAKKARIQGTVVLHAVIDKDGSVKDVQAVSGPKELQAPALDAVRQWTYRPYRLNGEPVKVETTMNIVFSLAP